MSYFIYKHPIQHKIISIGKLELHVGKHAIDTLFYYNGGLVTGVVSIKFSIDAKDNEIPHLDIEFAGDNIDQLGRTFWKGI